MLNTKKIINAIKIAAAGVIVTAGISAGANAQEWNNTGGTYKAGAGAKIKMRGTTASGAGASACTNASGTITGIGTNDATRIKETVIWSKTTDGQQVQKNLFFENLYVSGGTKTIDTVNVSGKYNAGTTLDGITGTPLANITYTGNFTYDGAGTGASSQNIVGTDVAKPYSTLTLDNGEKAIAQGVAVTVADHLNITEDSKANNDGTLTLNGNTNSSTIDGELYVTQNGKLDIEGTAAVKIKEGTGILDLAANSGTDALKMGPGTRLEISGELTNNNTAKTNVNFNASSTPSTVAYLNTGGVMPTICSNPYGRLEIGTAAARSMTTGDIYIGAGAMANGSDPAALHFTDAGVLTTNNYRVKFINSSGNAQYDNENGEIIGWVERTSACSDATKAAIDPNIIYFFNNKNTTIKFGTTTANSTDLAFFALQSLPNQYPTKRKDATYDVFSVKRQFEVDYDGQLPNTTKMDVKLGFKTSSDVNATELAGGTVGDVTLSASQVYDRLHLMEGWKNMGDYVGAEKPQNITTSGVTKSTWNAAGWNSVAQADIKLTKTAGGGTPGLLDDIYDASQVVLDGAPTKVISVVNGRWSNPNTWDGGFTPAMIDSVEIRHIIYTGLYNGNSLFGADAYDRAEDQLNTGFDWANSSEDGVKINILAKHVEIKEDQANGGNNPNDDGIALLIGNYVTPGHKGDMLPNGTHTGTPDANVMNFANKLVFGACGSGITNTVAGAPAADLQIADFQDTNPNLKGLYIMGGTGVDVNGNATGGNATVIRVLNLTNSGALTNSSGSTVEIGN